MDNKTKQSREQNNLIVYPFPIILLVDTSEIMSGDSMDEVNETINCFKENIRPIKERIGEIHIAVVEFNMEVKVIQPFISVDGMEKVDLRARHGSKHMGAGIRKAIDMAIQQNRIYREKGVNHFMPWIIMITKGAPDDSVDDLSGIIKQYDENDEMRFWSLLLDDTDDKPFQELGNGKRVLRIDLRKGDFVNVLFGWLASIPIRHISPPGEKPEPLPDLKPPENIDLDDPDNWMWM